MVKIAAAAALLSLASCSSYKSGGQTVKSMGSDGPSISFHATNFDQSAAFTQAIETITAAVISTATASTADSAIQAIKR